MSAVVHAGLRCLPYETVPYAEKLPEWTAIVKGTIDVACKSAAESMRLHAEFRQQRSHPL